MEVTSFSSIIICSIVRDAEKGLRKNLPVIEHLVSRFSDWKIVIYENDSVDHTKFLLHEWQKFAPDKIHIISEDTKSPHPTPKTVDTNVNPFFSRKRILKMAALRNKYLDYIERHGWSPEYLMVVDLDVAQLKLDGIIDSLSRPEDWDAITAYGYSLSPRLSRRYHDTYALCEEGKETIPKTERMIRSLADTYAIKCKNESTLIPVDSAFGGLAIYRYGAIKGLRYTVENNHDNRVEVHCEHFSFNRQMAHRGHDRIFINPNMSLKYQGLSFRFIINKLIVYASSLSKKLFSRNHN